MNVPGGSSSNDLQFSKWNGSTWSELGEINYNSGSLDFTNGFLGGTTGSGISISRRQANVIESEGTTLWLNYNNNNNIFLAAGSGNTNKVRVGDYTSGSVSKRFEVIGDAFIDTHLYVDNTVNIGVSHDSSLSNALSLGTDVALETSVKDYGATCTCDFSLAPLAKTTDVSFPTSANRAAGRSITILIDNSAGANQSLSFSSSWKFVGEKPAVIAAGKIAILTMTCFGTAESNVVCSYGVQD
jgi:hypothetical protein